MLAEVLQDIVGSLERDGKLIIFFLKFVIGDGRRAVIRDGSGLNDDVLLVAHGGHGLKHIACGRDRNEADEAGRLNRGRSTDECDLRSAKHGHLRDGIAHLAGGVIREIAHRVQGFLRRAGGDEQLLSGEVLRTGDFPKDVLEQLGRLRHLTGTGVATGEVAAGRGNHFIAEGLQLPEIILHDRILVHGGVHRRRDDLVAATGHDRGGEHIIREAICDLADDIGTRRGDHHDVCLLCDRDVLDLELEIPVEGVDQALVSGQGLEGDRVNEVRGVLRHQHMHVGMELVKRAREIGDFIGSDTSRYAEKHGLSLQHDVPPVR